MNISFQKTVECESPTIDIKQGEFLTINYVDLTGCRHSFCIGADQNIFLIAHEGTEAALAIDPAGKIQYSPPKSN